MINPYDYDLIISYEGYFDCSFSFPCEKWSHWGGPFFISDWGRIWREPYLNKNWRNHFLRREKIMRPRKNNRGYYRVKIQYNNNSKDEFVHRMVAGMFVENPYNFDTVNHIDGIKVNIHPSNLEWCTRGENVRHAYRTGLMPLGEDMHSAKLTNDDVLEIRRMLSDGCLQKHISEKFEVTSACISNIKRGKSWKHLI